MHHLWGRLHTRRERTTRRERELNPPESSQWVPVCRATDGPLVLLSGLITPHRHHTVLPLSARANSNAHFVLFLLSFSIRYLLPLFICSSPQDSEQYSLSDNDDNDLFFSASISFLLPPPPPRSLRFMSAVQFTFLQLSDVVFPQLLCTIYQSRHELINSLMMHFETRCTAEKSYHINTGHSFSPFSHTHIHRHSHRVIIGR